MADTIELKCIIPSPETFARMLFDPEFATQVKDAMLKDLGITLQPGENHLRAWVRDMCEYNEIPYNGQDIPPVMRRAIAETPAAQMTVLALAETGE